MIKKFDLPTFSINPKATDDKHRRIFKLIAQVNESNRETLGEAFIRIMADKTPKSDYAALDKYSKGLKEKWIIAIFPTMLMA